MAELADGASSWSQAFGYDRYGNRWVSAASPSGLSDAFTPTVSTNFDEDTNRLEVNNAVYDDAGNQIGIGGHTFRYDAENRLRESSIGTGSTTYAYDGDGRRVKKEAPGGDTVYVYDLGGSLIAEYSTEESGVVGTRYVTADALGSTRLVTKSDGTIASCYDYQPFGVQIAASLGNRPSCYSVDEGITQRFTGKERDAETGLDYFGARYLSGAQGRFTSPDPIIDNTLRRLNPQRWNRYAVCVRPTPVL